MAATYGTLKQSSKLLEDRESGPRQVRFLCSTDGLSAPITATGSTNPDSCTLNPPQNLAKPNARTASVAERFRAKFEPRPDGCWEWTGAIQTRGYGSFGIGNGKTMLAHRWAYEHVLGPIPVGLTLDHLCRNRRCVNPEHLEPVTIRENTMRGESFSAKNARATHCKRGHPLSGPNLRVRRDGKRQCRACRPIYDAALAARRKQAEFGPLFETRGGGQ